MSDTIPALTSYDAPALDTAFSTLQAQVHTDAAGLRSQEAREAFHLRWLGRKQGRLKLVSDAWLKTAPAEARKPLGMRFNQLKQEIEPALAEAEAQQPADRPASSIDITLPGDPRPGHRTPADQDHARGGAGVPSAWLLHCAGAAGGERLLQLRGAELSAEPSRARHAGHAAGGGSAGSPARDRLLMRTHTSPVQIRTMIAQDAAASNRRTGQGAPQRCGGRDAFAGVPPGGRVCASTAASLSPT